MGPLVRDGLGGQGAAMNPPVADTEKIHVKLHEAIDAVNGTGPRE